MSCWRHSQCKFVSAGSRTHIARGVWNANAFTEKPNATDRKLWRISLSYSPSSPLPIAIILVPNSHAAKWRFVLFYGDNFEFLRVARVECFLLNQKLPFERRAPNESLKFPTWYSFTVSFMYRVHRVQNWKRFDFFPFFARMRCVLLFSSSVYIGHRRYIMKYVRKSR